MYTAPISNLGVRPKTRCLGVNPSYRCNWGFKRCIRTAAYSSQSTAPISHQSVFQSGYGWEFPGSVETLELARDLYVVGIWVGIVLDCLASIPSMRDFVRPPAELPRRAAFSGVSITLLWEDRKRGRSRMAPSSSSAVLVGGADTVNLLSLSMVKNFLRYVFKIPMPPSEYPKLRRRQE